MAIIHDLFDSSGHVNDAGILLYAEGLLRGQENQLPKELLEHVEQCDQCRMEVFDYFEFLQMEGRATDEPHPFFDNQTKLEKSPPRLPLYRTLSIAASVVLFLVSTFLLMQSDLFKDDDADVGLGKDSTKNDVLTDTAVKDQQIKEEQQITEKQEPDTSSEVIVKEEVTPEIEVEPERIPIEEKNPNDKPVVEYERIAYLDRKIDRRRPSRGTIELLAPVVDSIYQTAPLYRWSGETKDTLLLEVFTKQTEDEPEQHRIAPEASKNTFALPNPLAPNLYYWTLKSLNNGRQKQIGLGRFYIR